MTVKDTAPTHPVTQRLWEAGITSVVVIDDAYNPPALDDLGAEIGDFWAGIIREESALAELKALKPGLESEDDIDEELINNLWARTLREEQSPLLIPCKDLLFSRHIVDQSELVDFIGNLYRIGITPICLGISEDLPDGDLKLFFLDFFLESNPAPLNPREVEDAIQTFTDGTRENPSIQASIDKAKQILSKFDDAFIILMSSKDGVEKARDSFREHTGLIEGMFDYAPKEQLASERELYLRLGISAVGLPVRHDIQRFVNALEASVKDASREFIARIKSLSFEDYLYIYSLSLRDEAQPLGAYMSWLYKSLLAHLVHNNDEVMLAQKKLDNVDMEKYVPLKKQPSIHLADIYRRSLTEPGIPTAGTHLRLGDLYVREGKDVLLVINADCDLLYSDNSSSRPFPADLSILLHPGRLKPVEESVKAKFKVTNLFFLDGQAFKIVWDHERVVTKKYGEVSEWLNWEGYSKKARLIAPHALEIQQHFAASLTRVGIPVAPPLPRPAAVQMFAKNEDRTLVKLGADIPRGVVIDREGFRFTVEGFNNLLKRVGEGIKHYTELRESYEESNARYVRLGRSVERLEALLQDCGEWFILIESSNGIPKENGLQIGSSGIFQVFCTPNLETAECIIALNLVSDEWIIGNA